MTRRSLSLLAGLMLAFPGCLGPTEPEPLTCVPIAYRKTLAPAPNAQDGRGDSGKPTRDIPVTVYCYHDDTGQ